MLKTTTKASILSLFLFLFCGLQGQGNYDPTINLQVTTVTPTTVNLTWISPTGATACSIRYETATDTTINPITNYNLNSAQIPRASSPGSWEIFTIEFVGNQSQDSLWDADGITIGGVLAVTEDIFYSQIQWVRENPGAYAFYRFTTSHDISSEYCLISPVETVHNIIDEYEGRTGSPTPDTLAWKMDLYFTLTEEVEQDTWGPIWYCEEVPHLYEQSLRRADEVRISQEYSCAPNPFKDRLIVKPEGAAATQVKRILVRDMLGRVHYEAEVDFSGDTKGHTINTQTWASGMYLIQVGEGVGQSVMKTMKY